jgi:FIMAH domain-containing protein
MRPLPQATASLSTVALALAMGCANESPSGPDRVIAPAALQNASATVIPCPPTVPTGYTLVYCFDFDLIPGVWHGFIVQLSDSQPAGFPDGAFSRTRLSADYLLISPTGFQRLGPGDPGDNLTASYAFQTEFNGTTWFDVFRILSPVTQPTQRVTIAVAKRPVTPAVQTAAIASQVSQLLTSGVLSDGQATSLTQKLDAIIAMLDEGKATPAANQLGAFVNQVQALMAGGVLGAAQGQALIDAANAVIARLTS